MIENMKERRDELECADSITSKLDFVGDAAAQYLVECSITAGVTTAGYRKIEKAMGLFMYSAIERFGFNSVMDKELYAAHVRRGSQQVHILPWTQLYGAMFALPLF